MTAEKLIYYALTFTLLFAVFAVRAEICTAEFDPPQSAYSSDAHSMRAVQVKIQPLACSWEAESSESWLTLHSPGGQRGGDHPVYFSLKKNAGPNRQAALTILDETFTVTQAGDVEAGGYALLVQGRVRSEEGVKSHRKTLDRVYKILLTRGFQAEHIRYFSYGGGDPEPTMESLEAAVKELRKLAIVAPAPFYLVMADHGGKNGRFYLNFEGDGDFTHKIILEPKHINAWLALFESEPALTQYSRVVVLGACYSGAFLAPLSAPGRLIITSSTDQEVSYKGPLEQDGVRSGEFFVEELFSRLAWNGSFQQAFIGAAKSIRRYIRQGGIPDNNTGFYNDGAAQHPWLDDNGDGKGSNRLDAILADDKAQDGAGLAAKLKLGFTPEHNDGMPVDILEVTPALYLEADETSASLWVKVSDPERAASAMVTVRPPTLFLPEADDAEETGQRALILQDAALTCDNETCIGRAENMFRESCDELQKQGSGRYELFYFVRDKITGTLAPLKRSLVYKNCPGNQPPAELFLNFPDADGFTRQGAEPQTTLIFDWEDSVDPEGMEVTYTLQIMDEDGETVHRQEDLPVSLAYISDQGTPFDERLQESRKYQWQVIATDSFGAQRFSEPRTFTANNAINPDFTCLNSAEISALFSYNPPRIPGDGNIFVETGYFVANCAMEIEVNAPCYRPGRFTLPDKPGHSQLHLAPEATFDAADGTLNGSFLCLPAVEIAPGKVYAAVMQGNNHNGEIRFHLVEGRDVPHSTAERAMFNADANHLHIPTLAAAIANVPAGHFKVDMAECEKKSGTFCITGIE
ncbi:MAG: hypothetical protein GY862_29445 [Gammaproteobacteria bacterium]|nr:hypothetical protein [Gammaproteobacteria bacterium]